MDKTNQIAKTFSQKLVLCLRKYSDHLKQNNYSINRKIYSNKKKNNNKKAHKRSHAHYNLNIFIGI